MSEQEFTYAIHPAMGVARVGPGTKPYDAPVRAGQLPTEPSGEPVQRFRDATGQLRPQSAVFQVYRYRADDPSDPGTALTLGPDDCVEWTVWLANKKACWFRFSGPNGSGPGGYRASHGLRNPDIGDRARHALILDPGPRSASSADEGSASFDLDPAFSQLQPFGLDSLGYLQAAASGVLRVTGGSGYAGQIDPPTVVPSLGGNYANNPGWYDSIADGPVTARVHIAGVDPVEVQRPAWVLCAPPKYAPGLVNIVTLRDTVFDCSVRHLDYEPALYRDGKFQQDYRVHFETEIRPILERPNDYQWVAPLPKGAVEAHRNLPEASPDHIIDVLRPTDRPNLQRTKTGAAAMPYVAGNNPFYPTPALPAIFLTMSQTQQFLLEQWRQGRTRKTPRQVSPARAVDHGVLDNCVGGPFVPGIEMTWICAKPEIYAEPFRIKHKPRSKLTQGRLFAPKLNMSYTFEELFPDGLEPGDVTAFMAQPWQSDYNLCSTQKGPGHPAFGFDLDFVLWWWPPQRPDWVKDKTGKSVLWIEPERENPTNADVSFPDGVTMVERWMDLGFVLSDDGGRTYRLNVEGRVE